MNIKADMRELRASPPPDILVATPGRLNDHLENHGLLPSMRDLSFLIFDEADQASYAKRSTVKPGAIFRFGRSGFGFRGKWEGMGVSPFLLLIRDLFRFV